MAEKIRKCIVCGNEYKYCPHCSAYNAGETWRFVYCSDDCRMIDAITSWYATGKINESEAKFKLSDYAVPENIINKDIVAAITAIKTMGKIAKEIKSIDEVKVEEPIVDEIVVEDTMDDVETIEEPTIEVEEKIEESSFVEKHDVKNKKKKYVNEV